MLLRYALILVYALLVAMVFSGIYYIFHTHIAHRF
jgi:uncharacterized iron-regulated membrane protein